MAIIRAIHGEMSGSIGGNTWSRNRGGQYVRQRTTPVNPSTARQQFVRANLASIAQAWQALSAVEQESWVEYATTHPITNSLGESIQLTGEMWWCRATAVLYNMALPQVDFAPVLPGPAALLTCTAVADASDGNFVLTYTETPLGAAEHLYVWASPPGSPGTNPNARTARFQGYSAAAAISPQTIATRWALLVGAWINIWIGVADGHGLVSGLLKARVQVQA